jgi:hypothetical protein
MSKSVLRIRSAQAYIPMVGTGEHWNVINISHLGLYADISTLLQSLLRSNTKNKSLK